MSRLLACLLAVLVLAGCGGTRETREPDVVVTGSATPAAEEEDAEGDCVSCDPSWVAA